MDPEHAEILRDLGPGLEEVLRRLGEPLPPDVSGAVFLQEVLEGGYGYPPDPGFHVWMAVDLLMGTATSQAREEGLRQIRERLAARRRD